MENRLHKKTKILYGVAGIGDSALYSVMGTFALFFFTTVAGINPAVAGTIIAVGAIWDVVSSSVVGYISDKTRTRIGRRRPFIMVAAFPLAVFCSLVFTVFDMPQGIRCVYYVVMFICFWTAYSIFFVPFTAWGAELTDSYEERTELRGIVYIFYSIGAAVGTVLPTIIVDIVMQQGKTAATGWLTVGVFVGIVSAAAIFITGWFVKDNEFSLASEEEETAAGPSAEKRGLPGVYAIIDIIKNYWQVLNFRPSKYIVLTSMFYLVGNSIYAADRMYFYTFNMNMSAKMITLVMLFQNIVSVLLVPALIAVNRKLDKRTLCIGGMGMAFAALVIYGFTGVPNIEHLLILSFIYGIGSICYWQLIPSMLYDTCDADRLVNKADRAGLIISLQGMTESVSEAIGFQILGVLLDLTGFLGEEATQNQATLDCMHVSFTFIPALFTAIAMIMMIRYPITRERHAEIIKKLNG